MNKGSRRRAGRRELPGRGDAEEGTDVSVVREVRGALVLGGMNWHAQASDLVALEGV